MRQLELRPRTWGGRRDGAGRPPSPGRGSVPHTRREPHDARCPAHVTLRASADVPSLRDPRLLQVFFTALRAASTVHFRVLGFTIQTDHVHLLVEADDAIRFERGIRGLAIRVARALNRAWGRTGRVWGIGTMPISSARRARSALRSST